MSGSTQLAERAARCFEEDGTLAACVPGFVARPSQQRLAVAVAQALSDGQHLLAEAGTGTGKTFAYLVPALLAGGRVLLSTGTRALQDQLFDRDIPLIAAALDLDLQVALLKGRSNYLCRYRLDRARTDPQIFAQDFAGSLAAVTNFAKTSETGELSDLAGIPERWPLWSQVTSTAENCLGADCPDYGDCFVVRARRVAQAAQVVVINHHLLCADLALKEQGFGELLGDCDAVIVDEAHQLAELAERAFGMSVSTRVVRELLRDLGAEARAVPSAIALLGDPLADTASALSDLATVGLDLPERGILAEVDERLGLRPALEQLGLALGALGQALQALVGASEGLDACAARVQGLRSGLAGLSQGDDEPLADIIWFEARDNLLTVHRTPLDAGAELARRRDDSPAVHIHLSATLAVGDSFEHSARSLGLQAPATVLEPSPFDFERASLLYLPPSLPEPNDPRFLPAMLDQAIRLVEAAQGRAFLLFTSNRALALAAERLRAEGSFECFVQRDQPPAMLLQAFRRTRRGVLLGTSTFWSGVDVAGDDLVLVVVDRLPFASPDEPVTRARAAAIRANGGNPFADWQLPQAVVRLKQGVGRLIRSERDRGVVMIADPRLRSKSYGRVFLASLPPMPITSDLDQAVAMLQAIPLPD